MTVNRNLVVAVIVGVVVLTAAVQIVDLHRTPEPDSVDFSESTQPLTATALENLQRTNHRTKVYTLEYSATNTTSENWTTLARQSESNLEFIERYDNTDRKYHDQAFIYETPYDRFESVDGIWIRTAGNWSYTTWDESPHSFPENGDAWVHPPRNQDATFTVLSETEETLIVSVDRPILDGYGERGATRIRIGKQEGRVHELQQRSRRGDTVSYVRLEFDKHGAVDIERPPEAPYSLRTFVYDLKRGPIPIHRWL